MCGICGKYNFGIDRNIDARTLESMASALSHRGPDDMGFYYGQKVAFGHRRLSILDLSPAGHQPMFSENRTVALIFNGEIYNYLELREELKGKGHSFRSDTDTEVILHAYEEYGLDCVLRFNGMFAFAIWDKPNRRLVLARDRLGVKPLYYYLNSKSITFASEIKSILEDRDVPKDIDTQALNNFLTLHYVPGPRTMFKGIKKLQPGSVLVINRSTVSQSRYWDIKKQEDRITGEKEAAEAIYRGLEDSVRKRMQSHVPVGALLSGGLDSSAILGLMTRIGGKPVPSFTAGYTEAGDDGYSEFRYARKAAAHFESPNHEAVVTPEIFVETLPLAIWHQDEPIGEPASIPLFLVSKLAKEKGVTVLLTGEGSDELFAGYNRHWGEILSKYILLAPKILRHSIPERILKLLPGAPLLKKGVRTINIKDFTARYMSWHTVFTDELKRKAFKASRHIQDTYSDVFEAYAGKMDGLEDLEKILYLDLNVWLPDDLLMKKDKMGMAASVEARVPFLDHRFVETAFNLATNLKVRRLETKYILKKSMERLLPREIIYRKKQGFPTPISSWMRNELKSFVEETLCSESSFPHKLFNRKTITEIVSSHMSGKEDNNRLIFPLLNFELWYRVFFLKQKLSVNIPAWRTAGLRKGLYRA